MNHRKKLISTSVTGWRRKDPLPSILEEWYGMEGGSAEIISHLPEPFPIKDAVDAVLSGGISLEGGLFSKIRNEWEEIVGSDIMEVSVPKSFRDGILYVEVKNSSWMMELRTSRGIILQKITSIHGKDSVKDIFLVPSG